MARGGMGIVYVAAAQGPAGFSKLVALKELRPELVEDEEFLTMFLEEARMAARLNHPNIVQTNDVDESHGRHFIAMEYLEGRSLYHVRQALRRSAAGFRSAWRCRCCATCLSALDYAHELTGFDGKPLGFVHRDVSPHNIFLTFEGHTKVIDFGIAKARDSSLETKTGVLKGRANYMAPEQLTRGTDRRSDIFSVGAVLFEVLSGRRLWQGMGEIEILAALMRGEIPALHSVRPETLAARSSTSASRRSPRGPRSASPPPPRCATRSTSICGPPAARRATARSRRAGRRSSTPSGSACARSSRRRCSACRRARAGALEALEFRDPRDAAHDSRRGRRGSHPARRSA